MNRGPLARPTQRVPSPLAGEGQGEGAFSVARSQPPHPPASRVPPTTRSIALRSNPLGADRRAVGRVVPARGEGRKRSPARGEGLNGGGGRWGRGGRRGRGGRTRAP